LLIDNSKSQFKSHPVYPTNLVYNGVVEIPLKNVSIVIPNWNGRELLAEYFPSVVISAEEYRAATNGAVEIVLVDDASTDKSIDWLEEKYGEHELVKILKLGTNVGFLRAVNKGVETAQNELVFLLNSDVRVEAGCIYPLVKHFDDEEVFAICCRAGRIDSNRLDGGGKVGRFERGFWRVFLNYEAIPSEADSHLISFYGSGGYTMYDRSKWGTLCGFQDCLAPNYWEDVEICYRAWKRGWKVLYEPTSNVTHKGSATIGKKIRRREVVITTERNRLLFQWINIHDSRMFAVHLSWLAIKLLSSLLTLRINYLRSFARAMGLISKVRAARRIEKNASVMSDRELSEKFARIDEVPGFYLVENEAAEMAFNAMRDIRTSTVTTP
jgi:GT2 family glycosyltransferase